MMLPDFQDLPEGKDGEILENSGGSLRNTRDEKKIANIIRLENE
jgi:hypothetical protein